MQTVRYYERIGLLPPAPRGAGNQRLYDGSARRRLGFIRHARELGFPLDDVRELLALADEPERSCAAVDAIAGRQLQAVEARIARLAALRGELTRMLSLCAEGRVADCRVIEALSDRVPNPPAGLEAAQGRR